jgi:ATP/ADP translocase
MKPNYTKPEWIANILAVIALIISVILTLYGGEIKQKISDMSSHWKLIIFILSIAVLLYTLIRSYIRNVTDEKHKYLEDEIKRLNKTTEDKFSEINKLDTMIVAKFITLSEATEMVNKILDRKINYLNNNFINLIEGKKIENAPNFYPDNEKALYEKLIKKINEPLQ